MAAATSHTPSTLHGQPIFVVGPQYVAPFAVDLTVTEKCFSIYNADYAVTDDYGNTAFKIKDKELTLHDNHILVDASGVALVTMRQKRMTAHHRWNAYRGESTKDKDLIFTVRKPLFQSKTDLEVFLSTNTSEETCDFKIRGCYSERSGAIFDKSSKTIVAQMHKEYTAINTLPGKDAFGLTVYPNVDHVFIIALVVILDEMNKDKDGKD